MKWVVTIGLCWLLATGSGSVAAEGDTVVIKLKDGSQVAGRVREEDAERITIEAELAAGTILQARTIAKTDVVEITRLTAAQIAERDLAREYEATGQYQLDPLNSYPMVYYDQVVKGVFQRFLTRHPDSPYEKEILEKVVEWRAERQQVASGLIKVQGKWMPAAEGARRLVADRVERLLRQGETYLTQGQYTPAVQRFQEAASNAPTRELVQQTRALTMTAYRQWLEDLGRERQRLDTAVQKTIQQVAHAREQLTKVRAEQQKLAADSVQRLGQVASASQLEQAQEQVQTAEQQLAELRAQLGSVEQQIGSVQARADAAGAAANLSPVEKPPVAPEKTAPATWEPDLLGSIVLWWQRWWPLILAVAFVIIGGLVTKLTR